MRGMMIGWKACCARSKTAWKATRYRRRGRAAIIAPAGMRGVCVRQSQLYERPESRGYLSGPNRGCYFESRPADPAFAQGYGGQGGEINARSGAGYFNQ